MQTRVNKSTVLHGLFKKHPKNNTDGISPRKFFIDTFDKNYFSSTNEDYVGNPIHAFASAISYYSNYSDINKEDAALIDDFIRFTIGDYVTIADDLQNDDRQRYIDSILAIHNYKKYFGYSVGSTYGHINDGIHGFEDLCEFSNDSSQDINTTKQARKVSKESYLLRTLIQYQPKWPPEHVINGIHLVAAFTNERRRHSNTKISEASIDFAKGGDILGKMDDYQAYLKSIEEFHLNAIQILTTLNLSKNTMSHQLHALAKNKFHHPHMGRRILADALMLISTIFLGAGAWYGLYRISQGKNFFFSASKTKREKNFNHLAITLDL